MEAEDASTREFPVSGCGRALFAGLVSWCLVLTGMGVGFAARGLWPAMFIPVIFIWIWVFVLGGPAYVLSLSLSEEGLEAFTLGGRRCIPWLEVQEAVFWDQPGAIRRALFDSGWRRSPAGRCAQYRVDGATFRLSRGRWARSVVAVSETLTVNGREAIAQICGRAGLAVPPDLRPGIGARILRSWVGTVWAVACSVFAVWWVGETATDFGWRPLRDALAHGNWLLAAAVAITWLGLVGVGPSAAVGAWTYLAEIRRKPPASGE